MACSVTFGAPQGLTAMLCIPQPPNALCDVRTKSGGSRSATEVVHKSLFIRMLVACLGDMGEEPMAVATTCLVERFAPAVCINTGITGSLDSDLKIGDVMVSVQCLLVFVLGVSLP